MEQKEEEKDLVEIPEELNKSWVLELIKEANDFAIKKFKDNAYLVVW